MYTLWLNNSIYVGLKELQNITVLDGGGGGSGRYQIKKKAVGGTDFLCMYITKNKQKQDQGKILSTNQIKPKVFSTGDVEIWLIFTNYMQPEDLYAIRQMRTLSTYQKNPFL